MKKKSKKYWSPEEEIKLLKLCEKDSQTEIARKMNRSVASVKGKRIRMNINCFSDQTDKLNITQISEITGIQKGSIGKTWRKYGLQLKKEGCFAVVSESELIDFMKNNPQLWKASGCDFYFFQRFDWFMKRLEQEKAGLIEMSHYRNRKEWTDLDISRFKMLKRRGFTHNEIAAELGRKRQSIDHINMRLKKYNANAI